MALPAYTIHQPSTDTYQLAAAAYDVKRATTPTQAEIGVDRAVVALPRQELDSHGIGTTINVAG